MRTILYYVALVLACLPLWGSPTATYTPHPQYFQPFDELYLSRYNGVGPNHYQGKMALHIGTYRIDTNDQVIKRLSLDSNLSAQYTFAGHTTWNPDQVEEVGFFAAAILSYAGGRSTSALNQGLRNPINSPSSAMNGIIEIDFFLISHNPHTVFIKDATYANTDGVLGTFTVNWTDSAPFWDSSNFAPMVDKDGNAIPPSSYLDSGLDTIDPSIPYGEPEAPETPVRYELAIDERQSFTIEEALEHKKALVARATLYLSGAVPGRTYGVNVTFSTSMHRTNFLLQRDQPPHYTIPYTLLFDGQRVTVDAPIEWLASTNGASWRSIEVTGINPDHVDMAPAGRYLDTIYVSLVPIDSI